MYAPPCCSGWYSAMPSTLNLPESILPHMRKCCVCVCILVIRAIQSQILVNLYIHTYTYIYIIRTGPTAPKCPAPPPAAHGSPRRPPGRWPPPSCRARPGVHLNRFLCVSKYTRRLVGRSFFSGKGRAPSGHPHTFQYIHVYINLRYLVLGPRVADAADQGLELAELRHCLRVHVQPVYIVVVCVVLMIGDGGRIVILCYERHK